MKVCFYSLCTGEPIYQELAITCMKSYLQTNSLEIDWILLCENENERGFNHDNIQPKIGNDQIHIRYEVLPRVQEMDFSKYNSLGWKSQKMTEFLARKIKFIDDYKDQYDVLVSVDLDTLFLEDISNYIEFMYKTNDIALLGQLEPSVIEWNVEHVLGLSDEMPYNSEKTINLGLAFFKPKLLMQDNWNNFLKISKGKEDFFNIPDKAYFCASIPNEKKMALKDLQLLVYPRLADRTFRKHQHYSLIHYSPSTVIKYIPEEELNFENQTYAVVYEYFDFYYNFVKSIEQDLRSSFIYIIEENKKLIDKLKEKQRSAHFRMKFFMGFGKLM